MEILYLWVESDKIDSNGNILASTNYDMYNNFDFTILSNGDIAVVLKKVRRDMDIIIQKLSYLMEI